MRRAHLFAGLLACLTVASPALACSVCFGDPESPMARGAVMGVVVLIGIVGVVLSGIAGVGVFWIQRSQKQARPPYSESLPT